MVIAGILLRQRIGTTSFCTKLDFIKIIPKTFTDPIKLQFQLISAQFARKLAVRRDDTSLFEVSCDAIDHLTVLLSKYKRDLLGLEALYQLTGTAILLFYSVSETKTSQGLAAMFQEDNILGLPVSSKLAITISFVLSLFSFTSSHIEGLGGHRAYFPFSSKAVLLLAIFCATLERVSTMIIFFAPPLGLFDFLRHYQGKSYKSLFTKLACLNKAYVSGI